ncbi:MAG TPA: hypothetical protein VHE35_31745 [Kofleriaceae bacterium]|nr:hypothetical protein [Kofleriaceae bacterium]
MRVLALVAAGLLWSCSSSKPEVKAPAPAPAAGEAALEPITAPLAAAGIDRATIACNSENRFGEELRPGSEAGAADMIAAMGAAAPTDPKARADLQEKLRSLLFWRMVRAVLIEGNNNNLGAIPLAGRTWTDAEGKVHPVVIFRTGITPSPDADGSCFASLLGAGHVHHVVNLFDGKIPIGDLTDAERKAATEHGASYVYATDEQGTGYGRWRDTLRDYYDPTAPAAKHDVAARDEAFRSMARLIREQILMPDGAPPTGNIHLHCGGGMHRSGLIAGIIEKCVNHAPMATVLAHYRYHVAWHDDAHPGGLEPGNLQVLQEFDCSLLGAP